jgi:hypothetical protein
MYAGFPEVAIAGKQKVLNVKHEQTAVEGAVMTMQFAPVKKVVLDSHALLSIIKHAKNFAPRNVFGKTLGMQFGDTLEISSCLPTIQTPTFGTQMTDEERDEKDAKDEADMMQQLLASGYDAFVVGRYAGCAHSTFLSPRQLTAMSHAIARGEPAVLIAYDPLRTNMGKLFLRALTPSDAFLQLYKNKMLGGTHPAPQLAQSGLVVEVPVEVRNSALQEMLLHQFASKPRVVKNVMTGNGEMGRYSERAMQLMTEGLDKLRSDVNARAWAAAQQAQRGPVAGEEEDKTAGTVTALKPESHLLVQQLMEQAQHVSAVADGLALNLDFARNLQEE